MRKIIYADHAATTKLSVEAFEAMRSFLTGEYGNPSSGYQFARGPRVAIQKARATIAKCIGAEPEEIFFTSGGSEADNWALKGTAFLYPHQRKRVIISSIEHHAIIHAGQFLSDMGYDIRHLHSDNDGVIQTDSLVHLLNDNTVIVSVMLANNEIGTIEPIQELAQIAHIKDVLFHTDAVQAVGHIPIDVNVLGVDMLSASAHKFNGPRGIGFLYCRKGVQLRPLIDGGAQESGQRAGTENVAAIVGMAAALKANCDTMQRDMAYLQGLGELFHKELTCTCIDYRWNGSINRLPGTVSVSFKDVDGEMLLHRLDLMGIEVSTGSACNSKAVEVSHVLQAIQVPEDYIHGTIRLTFGKDNTEKDIIEIVKALERIIM